MGRITDPINRLCRFFGLIAGKVTVVGIFWKRWKCSVSERTGALRTVRARKPLSALCLIRLLCLAFRMRSSLMAEEVFERQVMSLAVVAQTLSHFGSLHRCHRSLQVIAQPFDHTFSTSFDRLQGFICFWYASAGNNQRWSDSIDVSQCLPMFS